MLYCENGNGNGVSVRVLLGFSFNLQELQGLRYG